MDPRAKITIETFEPAMLPLVRGFSERYWNRPTTDAYYDWRYIRSLPFGHMFVALRGNECVGTLFALRKPYRLRGERVYCLEVFDWHALTELRGAGVGIRLMRAMMKRPERIMAVGGTADVHATLPLMGWQPLGIVQAFELVARSDLIVERLQRTRRLPGAIARPLLAPLSKVMLTPRRKHAPPGGEVREVGQPGEEVLELYRNPTGQDLVQEPDLAMVRWLTSGRWSGAWRFFQFRIDGSLRGWSMTRLHVGGHGLQGVIVELFAPGADAELYHWMVSQTAASLLPDRPRRIIARAACPILQRALGASGFRHAGVDVPVRTWPSFGADIPHAFHFTFLHSDAPMLPYVNEL